MKNLKSVLAVVMALCLMLCLAVPVFATSETTAPETTAAAAETTAAAEETTGAAEETTGAAEETTGAAEEHDHDHDEDTTTTGDAKEEEGGVIKVIRVILTVLEVIASVIMVVVVLLQSGKEAGLSGALSGNSDSYLSKMGGGSLDKMLAKSTKWVALAWIVLTLLLSLI